MAKNVSIATKPLVYSAFRYINNKVWNALAEYVDNSFQSYEDHKDILSSLNPNGNVKVTIEIDFEKDVIIIEDNAFGITEDNYQRAFELANIPLDASGLNEFGMGMKVSSIWLCDVWKVETSAYGEDVRKTMCFNLKEVVDKQETELPVLVEPADKEEHYTRITLSSLSLNKPTSRQLTHIKKHLASIYTKHIREGELNLIVNGEAMVYQDLKILKAPYYKIPNGEEIEWRQEIEFEAPSPKGGYYRAKGFIALLETMSTSTDNGFLLFRRGRVIGTSYEDKYRPEFLCGQVGSPRYKRIFGEIYLEGFDVSFTKNSFQEDDDFNSFLQMLRDKLLGDKNFDIFGQAQNYIKPKTQKEKKLVGQNLIKQIAEEMSKTIDLGKPIDSDLEKNEETKEEEIHKSVDSNEDTDMPLFPNYDEAITTPIKLYGGKTINLTINCENGSSKYGFYNLTKSGNDYVSVINLKNPFFEQYSELLSKKEGIEMIAYVIKFMVASEIVLQENGSNDGAHFRNEFNKLYGQV